ncbi:hypothetical protein WDU94_007706, partial [Cyamophila willieti]
MASNKHNTLYTKGLKALQMRMGVIFNNANFSDTVFTVKKQKFYALSQLVAVSSTTLNDLISEHFAFCDDRDITLHNVKCEESFSIILQYMYGLDINFGNMTPTVLCEVMNLAQTYQLNEFVEDLKQHLSKIELFQIDSLTALLNTSRKFNLNELYRKLTYFAFENAEEFVKLKSTVNLQYEVLLDLLKSDWFCAPEIDILAGLLIWHDDMKIKKRDASVEVANESNKVQDISDKSLEDGEVQSSSCETDCSDASADFRANFGDNTKDKEEDNALVKDKDNEIKDGMDKNESSDIRHQENSQLVTSNPTDKFSNLVESFSNNVLKSLLSHIRIKQITMLDFVLLCETSLFKQYELMLRDGKLFSQTNERRKKYVSIVDSSNGIKNKINNNPNLTQYLRDQQLDLKNHPESSKSPPNHIKLDVSSLETIGSGAGSSRDPNRKQYSREQLLELRNHPESTKFTVAFYLYPGVLKSVNQE